MLNSMILSARLKISVKFILSSGLAVIRFPEYVHARSAAPVSMCNRGGFYTISIFILSLNFFNLEIQMRYACQISRSPRPHTG